MEPIFKLFLNEYGVLSCALLDMFVTGRSWKILRNVVIIKKELQTNPNMEMHGECQICFWFFF